MISGTNSAPPVARVIVGDSKFSGPKVDGGIEDTSSDGLIGSERPTGQRAAPCPSFEEQYRRLVQAIISAPLGGDRQAEGDQEGATSGPDTTCSESSFDEMPAWARAKLKEAIADARA